MDIGSALGVVRAGAAGEHGHPRRHRRLRGGRHRPVARPPRRRARRSAQLAACRWWRRRRRRRSRSRRPSTPTCCPTTPRRITSASACIARTSTRSAGRRSTPARSACTSARRRWRCCRRRRSGSSFRRCRISCTSATRRCSSRSSRRSRPRSRSARAPSRRTRRGAPSSTIRCCTFTSRSFAIDFFAWVDDRYVRIMTLTADVELPLSLEVDGTGKLTPVFGDLTTAFTNVTVTNSDLLAESPDQLAQAFPMLLGIAVGQLTGALSGIALPALMGLQDQAHRHHLDRSRQRTARSRSCRSSPTWRAATAPSLRSVDTQARRCETMQLPPTREFAVDARGTSVPAAVLAARRPRRRARSSTPGRSTAGRGRPTRSRRASTVTDPQLWMQGRHTIDVRARVGRRAGDDRSDAGARRRHRRHRGADRRLRRRRPRAARRRQRRGLAARGAAVPLRRRRRRLRPVDRGDRATLPAGARRRQRRRAGARRSGQRRRPRLPRPLDRAVGGRLRLRRSAASGADERHDRRRAPPRRHRRRAPLRAPSLRLAAPHRHRRRRRAAWRARRLRRRRLLAPRLGKGDFANPIDEIGRYHDVVFKRRHALRQRLRRHHGRSRLRRDQGSDDEPELAGASTASTLTESPDMKDGYRFGISDPGPDVGQYTSIALSSGKPMIAYFDASNGALKFARGPHPFDVSTVDRARRHRRRRHVRRALARQRAACRRSPTSPAAWPSGDHFTSELRVAVAANDHPTATRLVDLDRRLDADLVRRPLRGGQRLRRAGDGQRHAQRRSVDSRPASPSTPRRAPPPARRRRRASRAPAPTCCSRRARPTSSRAPACSCKRAATRGPARARLLRSRARAISRWRSARPAPGRSRSSTATIRRPTSASSPPSRSPPTTASTSPTSTPSPIACSTSTSPAAAVPATPDVVDDGTRADGPHSVGAGANLALDGNGSPRVVYQDQQLVRSRGRHRRRLVDAHGSRDRHPRLRLLPAPALRRRQALHDRVRLRPAERRRARRSARFQVSVSAP